MPHPEYELRGQITQQQGPLEEIMIRCAKSGQSAAASHLSQAIGCLLSAKAVLAYKAPSEEKERK